MSNRLLRLANVLQSEGFDAFLACTPVSMGYLAGLFEDGHERLLLMAIRSDGQMRVICPALTANQAQRVGIQDIRLWVDGEDPATHLIELANDWNLKAGRVVVDNEMRADVLLTLQESWPAALFKAGDSILSQLTRIKDETEIASMQAAADIADAAYEAVKPLIKPGQTELEVGKLLSDAMQDRGGKPTFAIVAAGPNGAEPHHLNDNTALKTGDMVILDFGCEVDGYQSDITRVVALGDPGEQAKQVYNIVFQAHMAGRKIAAKGVTAGEVDAATRQVIEDAGYGTYFVHRTGHGIGMRGHESPNINPGSEFVLESGNCFSIEPGIYLPGEFGIRIENIVMARETDSYSFNQEPSPTLEILG